MKRTLIERVDIGQCMHCDHATQLLRYPRSDGSMGESWVHVAHPDNRNPGHSVVPSHIIEEEP